MNILITGITGFIGYHLARELHNLQHTVFGIDNFSEYYDPRIKRWNQRQLEDLGITVLEGDLKYDHTYTIFPKEIDFIIHLAAQPGIASTSTFENYLDNNIIATQKLIAHTERTYPNLLLFINISTSSVYGLDATHPEETVPQPASNYGVTKLAAEQLVLKQDRSNIFPACSLRLYSVYGPGERPDKLFTKLICAALNGTPFTLFEGSLSHKRSFTYVSDIVRGIIAAIDKYTSISGDVINIGSDREYTTKQGIEVVEKLLGPIVIEMKPARFGDQKQTKAIIEKAKERLAYHPNTTLEEGVQQQIIWVRQMKNEGIL